jgi:hypothetical protein
MPGGASPIGLREKQVKEFIEGSPEYVMAGTLTINFASNSVWGYFSHLFDANLCVALPISVIKNPSVGRSPVAS